MSNTGKGRSKNSGKNRDAGTGAAGSLKSKKSKVKKADSLTNNRRAAHTHIFPDQQPTNAELKRLLDRTLVRFGNWKVQVETNPNPKMVHNLKSIVSIIDTITSISESKMRYSYKDLYMHMSYLIDSVAKLNLTITNSLSEDDYIDEDEEENINSQMMTVIQRTVELIRLAQQSFGMRNRLLDEGNVRLESAAESAADNSAGGTA